jgi:hypothetical protein
VRLYPIVASGAEAAAIYRFVECFGLGFEVVSPLAKLLPNIITSSDPE